MAKTIKLSEINPDRVLKPGDTYVIVNKNKCVGCCNCIVFCRHFGVSGMNFIEGKAKTNGICHHEGHCIKGCPVRAIARYQLTKDGENMDEVDPVNF